MNTIAKNAIIITERGDTSFDILAQDGPHSHDVHPGVVSA